MTEDVSFRNLARFGSLWSPGGTRRPGKVPRKSTVEDEIAYRQATELYRAEAAQTAPATFRDAEAGKHFMHLLGKPSSHFEIMRSEGKVCGYALGIGADDIPKSLQTRNKEFFRTLAAFFPGATITTFFGVETVVDREYRNRGFARILTEREVAFAQDLGYRFFGVLTADPSVRKTLSRNLGAPEYAAQPAPQQYPHELLLYRIKQ